MTDYTWVGAFSGGTPNLSGDFDDSINWSVPGTNGNVITPAGPPGPGDTANIGNYPTITVTCTGQTVENVLGGTLVGDGDDSLSLEVTGSMSGSTIQSGMFDVDDAFDVVVDDGLFTAATARNSTFNGGTITVGQFATDSGITINGADVTAQSLASENLNISLESGSLDIDDPIDMQGFGGGEGIFQSGGSLQGDDLTIGGTFEDGDEGEGVYELGGGAVGKIGGDTDLVDGDITVGEPILGYSGSSNGGSLTLFNLSISGVSDGLTVGNGGKVTVQDDVVVDTTIAGVDDTIAVDGKGSSLSIGGDLDLGDDSAAANGGASVTNGATITVSGNFGVGISGDGDFDADDATLTLKGIVGVAADSGSDGTLELTHSPVEVTGGEPIIFGLSGQATVTQTNGGMLTDSMLIIGGAGSDDTYSISSTGSSSASTWYFNVVSIGSNAHGGDGDQLNDSTTEGWIKQQLQIAPEASMNVSGNSEINIGADSIFNIRPDHNTESYVVVSHQGTVLLEGTIKADWTVAEGLIEVGGYYEGSPVGGTSVIDGNLSGGYKYGVPGSPLKGKVIPSQVGAVLIDPNATLELTGGDAPTIRTAVAPIIFEGNGSGTLKLDSPSLFFGGMLNLAGGDKIILANVTAAGAPTLTPSTLGAGQYTLSVKATSGTTYSYQTTLFATGEGVTYAQTGDDLTIEITGTPRNTFSGTAPGLSGSSVSSTDDAPATTDSAGNFTLAGGSGAIVVTGGTDASTGLAFAGQLEAPFNSTVVTPLTTVLVALQNETGDTVAQAQPELLSGFGLDSILDLTTFNSVTGAEQGEADSIAVFGAEAKVLNTADIISSALAGLGVSATDGFGDAMTAIAGAVHALGSGATLDLSDDATLATLVTDAGTAAGKNLGAISSDAAKIIAAVNGSVDQDSQSDRSNLVFDTYAVERVVQGSIGPDLQAAAGDPTTFAADVSQFSGADLNSAITQSAAALTAAGITASAPPVPYADTAANILALTSDDLANIKATDFTGMAIDDSVADLADLTSQQWATLAADEKALGGTGLVLADSDDDILSMTGQQAQLLAANGVNSIIINNGGIDLPVGLALDFADDKQVVSSADGDGIVVQDTAGNIESLTPTDIAGLQTEGVMGLASTDASLKFDVAQALAMVSAGFTVTEPTDDTLSVADTAGNIGALTQQQIAALHTLGVTSFVTENPCYCRGTLIRTKRGERPVEELEIGDEVVTKSGAARPIKWIGRRGYGGRFVIGRKDILPIRIKAGALENGVPQRDLWISPHHAMYLEGVLIEARDLVNGVSIVQADGVESVEYFHIELESHDIVIAEGAFSETYVDDSSRVMFINAHEYSLLYPGEYSAAAHYFAPRRGDGYEYEAARRRIAARAGLGPVLSERAVGPRGRVECVSPRRIAGWAQNPEFPDAPVCLDIVVRGELMAQVLADLYREDLAGIGIGDGHHGFEFSPSGGLTFWANEIEVRRSRDGALIGRSFARIHENYERTRRTG